MLYLFNFSYTQVDLHVYEANIIKVLSVHKKKEMHEERATQTIKMLGNI